MCIRDRSTWGQLSVFFNNSKRSYSVCQQMDPYSYGFSFDMASFNFDNLNCVIEPTYRQGGLYLGNLAAAQDLNTLRAYNIKAVLTVAYGADLAYDRESIHFHEVIEADDIETYNLSVYFEKAHEFIEFHRNRGTNVYVHCFAGVSRSATIIIAYLMKKFSWNFEKSYKFAKAKRRQVWPNSGFIRQLRNYERYLMVYQHPLLPCNFSIMMSGQSCA
eukprot:TRINITY_DN12875_c0_g1_i7.p1 TRINITY_DN12875_c0_g1~~TRINITY_DN12875_c0_g1_i7.p1  ORF type:complete len:237 (+),score=28.06 TRINITY_DN12875_c0_g1_i7:61-711(+)